jgi:two-component system sensor histidine kinase QseC
VSLAARGSVRRRLLGALLGGLSAIWIAAAVVTAWETQAELRELLDAHLAQSASLLLAQLDEDLDEIGEHEDGIEVEHAESRHRYARNVAFQVWGRGGRLLLHSADAPTARLSDTETGFSDATVGDRDWRVFSAWGGKRRYLVQVAEVADARRRLTEEILERLVRPLALALPLVGFLVWVAVGTALRPVGRVGDEIARRGPGFLAPIAGSVPVEIAPMVERLNGLLARVDASLEGERRFTSDAAHELRTPLAAVRAQIQVAAGAVDPRERARALDQALVACDRATHLVEQLLTLARLDSDAWRSRAATVEIHGLAARALAEAAPAAGERRIELALEGEAGVRVAGHEGLLGVLLRNLLDNAIRYSPDGGAVTVRVVGGAGEATLSVCDQGPGIPPHERAQVLRRFHRLEGTAAPGSGLGLSIVARIAELHGARLTLADGDGGRGLCVAVALPRES